ncbi:MAG: hypothetical protein LBG12_01320 [Synergistaceae bacterium]|nr:hypothetical protein [Synergistaceae bacterium]
MENRRQGMRRSAFWSGPVVIFMLLASIASAYVMERVRAKFLISMPVAGDIGSAEAACIGLKYAEDWLLESAISGQFPRARVNSLAVNIPVRIEAVRDDGTVVPPPPGELMSGVSLYVADLDYEPGLFTGALANRADTPFIPRMPAADDDYSYVRFYFLRASFPAAKNAVFVSEEILSVALDKATLNISAKRLLCRSGLMSQ